MNYTHRKKRVCEARNQYGNGKMTEGDVKPLVRHLKAGTNIASDDSSQDMKSSAIFTS